MSDAEPPAPGSSAPREPAILRADGLAKYYPDGDVQALRGVSLEIAAGEFRGDHRAQRLRQEHAPAPARRPRSTDRGRGLLPGPVRSPGSISTRTTAREIGFVFQSFYLLPTLTALENIQIPMFEGPWPRRERARRAEELLGEVGLAHRGRPPARASSRSASASGSRSRGRSPTTRAAPGRRADRQPRQQEPGRDPPSTRPDPRPAPPHHGDRDA